MGTFCGIACKIFTQTYAQLDRIAILFAANLFVFDYSPYAFYHNPNISQTYQNLISVDIV